MSVGRGEERTEGWGGQGRESATQLRTGWGSGTGALSDHNVRLSADLAT